MSHPSKYLMEN